MSTLGPVSRPSVPDQVFARLCDLIITGQYEPGERLPTQRALASDFGVNMASVREAVKRLEQLRLVEVRHGDATRVVDWRKTGLEALTLLGVVDDKIVRPLFEARGLVLSQVAGLAASKRDDGHVAKIAEAVAAVAAAPDDEAAQLADWAFVSAIIDASNNLVFELIGNSVRELYLSHSPRFIAIVTERDELEPLYGAVLEAITAKDPAAAIAAMTDLATAQETRMLEAL